MVRVAKAKQEERGFFSTTEPAGTIAAWNEDGFWIIIRAAFTTDGDIAWAYDATGQFIAVEVPETSRKNFKVLERPAE